MNIVDHLIMGLAAPRSGRSLPGGQTGCKVCPVPMGAWAPVCRGLQTGELDGALISLPLAMDLFGAGLDIGLVMLCHRGGSLLAGRAEMTRLDEFKGKSLLIPHRLSIQHMLMHKLMTDRGMDLELTPGVSGKAVSAEAVPMPLMPEMAGNDRDGDIAGFISADPFVSVAAAQGHMKPFLTSQALWKNHPCCGLVAGRPLLENPKALGRLVFGLFRAAADLDRQLSGPRPPSRELISTAAVFLDQSPKCAVRALTRSGVTFSPGLLIPEKEALNTVQEYMAHPMGLISSPADLDEFIHPQFAQEALAELDL